MNFNIWNIKDMLSIPSGSGSTKSSNWANNQTDYSSLSDSQFLFGSQFCPESSETLSAPLDIGVNSRDSKQSQKNSLDSEPSIFTKYQTKPQLFGEDTNDGGLFPLPLPVGKSKGLLEQFEEKKQRAKDKCDSETLYNFISHIRESIHKLQTSMEKSEEHLSSRSQSILDSLATVAKTLQESVQAQSDLVLQAMQDKGSTEQAILEMQKKFEARQAEFIEMKSNLKHLELAVAQQSKDFQQLCEQLGQLNVPSVLAELKSWISAPRVPWRVKDSDSQTSPPLAQGLNFTRQDEYASEEPAPGQAQALPPSRNLRMGSLRPREFGVWIEGPKKAALQQEAAGESKRNRGVRDKAIQTNCKNQLITKTSSENHGASIQGRQLSGVRNLVSKGALRLISLDVNNFIPNQKRQTKDVFSCDPYEQRLVTEQKGRTGEHGRKGQQQPLRKAHRGRPRKLEQTRSKTGTFNSKCPQPPVPGSQRSLPKQQEPLAQPLQLCAPSSPTKPAQRGAFRPRTVEAAQGTPLQLSGHSSQISSEPSNSSTEDHQMSWFSDLNPESSQSPLCQQPGTNSSKGDHPMIWFSNLNPASSQSTLCKQPGKNVLYDLGFDSSDDDF